MAVIKGHFSFECSRNQLFIFAEYAVKKTSHCNSRLLSFCKAPTKTTDKKGELCNKRGINRNIQMKPQEIYREGGKLML